MSEEAEIIESTTSESSVPETSESNAGPSSLAQYAQEVEELTGERVTNDPVPESDTLEDEPAEKSEDTPKEEKPKTEPVTKPRTPPAPKPARPSFEEILKDPEYARAAQSEIDRRAAAQERSKREQVVREEAERARINERAEYERLVALANGPEYDDDAQAARKELAARESTQLMRESLYQEVSPVIRETVIEDLTTQINGGYARIPEFAYQEVVDRLHNSRFDDAGVWLSSVVDGISAIRIAQRDQEWSKKFDAEVKEKATSMAEAMTAEQMGKLRATLPNPDISPSITDGREEKRYRNRAELARDVDDLLPRLGAAGYRQLRESLPEGE